MTKPYLIRTPEFKIDSGGIRVMWGLYGWLLAKGQVVFINAQCSQESIGIYPEIYHGNEMNATKVIRYILQKPGMMGQGTPGVNFRAGPTHFNDMDEIYVFSKVYDEWDVDDNHILFLPIIDLNTFRNHHKIRYNKAFYVGKGLNLGEHPKDAIELTRDITKDQQELSLFLNNCQVLYVYDRMSAIMECARLCGCKVIYMGDLPLNQLELYEPGMNGLGYREEVDFDSDDFRYHYKELIFTFSKRLDTFIERTQV